MHNKDSATYLLAGLPVIPPNLLSCKSANLKAYTLNLDLYIYAQDYC
jgi:hypothetical protein